MCRKTVLTAMIAACAISVSVPAARAESLDALFSRLFSLFLARPCDDNGDCNRRSYCAKAEGNCDGRGVCRDRGRICPAVVAPVCGCDGQTYGNACEAAVAGVNVAADGPCIEEGKCCTESGQCIETDEAACHAACGHFAGAGTTCGGTPIDCPIPVILPIACCLPGGACEQLSACACEQAGGIPDASDNCASATCQTGVQICGGIQGLACDDPDEFCKTGTGECCCDFFGICTPRPDGCPLLWAPVCGCDGETYGNACFADAAGVSVDFEGACDGSGGDGCTTNADCLQPPFSLFGQYCDKGDGNCTGTGTCVPAPQICLDVWSPVCGCDGNTYSNDCYAHRVGVNVASGGDCGF